MPVRRFPPFPSAGRNNGFEPESEVSFGRGRAGNVGCCSQSRESHPFGGPDDFSYTCGCGPAVHPNQAYALHSTGRVGATNMLFSNRRSSDTLDQEERKRHHHLEGIHFAGYLRSLGEGQTKYANAKEIIAYNEDISLHNTKRKFTIPLLGKRIQHPKTPEFAAYDVDLCLLAMADDRILPIPNISLPQHLFTLVNPSLSHLHDVAWKSLLEGIEADNMAPYYRVITSSSGIDVDPALLETMEKANEEQLKQLDERLAEAEKTEGESEISDALKERANHLTRIGDKDAAVAAQQLALEKTPGLGSRTDITSTLVRIGFFFGDNTLITENLAKAEKLIEEGGDWDRRNRLKFKSGGELLLDALSTFTATELISYNDLVALTIIVNTLTLARVDLKKKRSPGSFQNCLS
ncbi:26S proteasome subunit RPN7-domain-containing protein [Pisolithus albus]|nr:26S proteasome subunit RPN7-domain-containing protein [Pisolithus albus]